MALYLVVLAVATPFLTRSGDDADGVTAIVTACYTAAGVVVAVAAYRSRGPVVGVFDGGLLLVGRRDGGRVVYWRELVDGLTRNDGSVYVHGVVVAAEETVLSGPGGVRLQLDHYERRAELVAGIEAGTARWSP